MLAMSQSPDNTSRTFEFWRRAGGIYLGYKAAQVHAAVLRLRGFSKEEIREIHWKPHHARSGNEMHSMCVDLRGFYIKAGQFIGTRSDFVPEGICSPLRKLQDEVPPMGSEAVGAMIKEELHLDSLDQVFEWIDLERPLGSASISQVHKARLKQFERRPNAVARMLWSPVRGAAHLLGIGRTAGNATSSTTHTVAPGETAWAIANVHGVSLDALVQANRRNGTVDVHALHAGETVWLPESCREDVGGSREARQNAVLNAVRRCNRSANAPRDGVVAVKVQYPDALERFQQDLGNLRMLADFLSRTELPFDLVSAVDELRTQVALEFDFRREARVMDTTAMHLRRMAHKVEVPRSVPGLVTERLLVMNYLDGVPLNKLQAHVSGLSEAQKRAAFRRVIEYSSEAYGRMILGTGLFQADAHPGNILVMAGGRVGLLDYGQSKQLTQEERLMVARLIVAITTRSDEAISKAMEQMHIMTEPFDVAGRAKMGTDMFDTVGKIEVFNENSPLKKAAITDFPKNYFLILRVVQLLRGMASRMDVDFSSAEQWLPFADSALREVAETEPFVPKGKYFGL